MKTQNPLINPGVPPRSLKNLRTTLAFPATPPKNFRTSLKNPGTTAENLETLPVISGDSRTHYFFISGLRIVCGFL